MRKFLFFLGFVLASTLLFSQENTPSADSAIYVITHTAAEFKGGNKGMYQYIMKTMRYPADARAQKIEGRVYVSFVVEKDGRISQVKTIKELFPSLDQEAIRIVQSMPNWTPGKDADGNPVRTQFNLPIVFKMN